MTDERVVPADLGAEVAVLSSILTSPRALEDAGRLLEPDDFYKPGHGHIYAAAVHLYSVGQHVDTRTVAARLMDQALLASAGGPAELTRILAQTTARTAHVVDYAARVLEMKNRREMLRILGNVTDAVYSGTDADIASEAAIEQMRNLGGADLTKPVDDVVRFEDWLDSDDATSSRWVIPGTLRSDWRLMLTAPPGVGKTTFTRQMAYAASVGIHPFTQEVMDPVRTLLVDLENPVSAVEYTGRMMLDQAGVGGRILRPPDWNGGRGCMVWSRQAGINILDRRDRLELERRIMHVDPDLVVIGPIYKSFRKDPKRQSDEITEEVCSIFDDLRTRHDFALVLEHHSPRNSPDLFPFGSSVWERWPEFGKTLRQDEKNSRRVVLGQFRQDRIQRLRWPVAFSWSKEWPFKAEWGDERPEPPAGEDF